MPDRQIEQLHDALEESSDTVAITGAGISLACGGYTYGGISSNAGVSRRDMTSNDPDRVYHAYYRSFLESLFEHNPSVAHMALVTLETAGKLQGIITTNVDCIHTKAGSKNVAEIQGSFQVNICTGCGAETHGYEIWNHGKMPVCEKCGSTLMPFNMYSHAGLLTPEVRKAQDMIRKADLILIIGSNGCYAQTYWDYRKKNAKIIQINPGRTYFDRVADLNIRRGSDPVFQELMELMELE